MTSARVVRGCLAFEQRSEAIGETRQRSTVNRVCVCEHKTINRMMLCALNFTARIKIPMAIYGWVAGYYSSFIVVAYTVPLLVPVDLGSESEKTSQ